MVDAWMPGARRIRAQTDGGPLKGGAPRVVWQAIGADPRLISACSAAQRLDQEGRPPHLVWSPTSGDIIQLIPILRAGCSLGGPERIDYVGGATPRPVAPINTEGRLCVQIGVMAWPSEPFTAGPMNGVEAILGWLDAWRVPRRWPAGRPLSAMIAHAGTRSRAVWALGGHYGASQLPGCEATGPGDIDIDLLTGPEVTRCPVVPRQHGETPPAAASRVALETMLAPGIRADTAVAVPSLANASY